MGEASFFILLATRVLGWLIMIGFGLDSGWDRDPLVIYLTMVGLFSFGWYMADRSLHPNLRSKTLGGFLLIWLLKAIPIAGQLGVAYWIGQLAHHLISK